MIFFKNGASIVSNLAVVVGPHTTANHSMYATSRLTAAATMKATSQRCDYHITCGINTSRVQWLPLITMWTPNTEPVCQNLIVVAVKTKYAKFLKSYEKKHVKPPDSDFIDYLNRWPPSPKEIKNHHDKPPPIKVNWKERLKRLRNCTFLGPKYRQLVYQTTTSSVIDGVRLHNTNPLRSICPHCGTVASTQHMVTDCVFVKSIW